MDYNELVQKRQEGVIDDLEFCSLRKIWQKYILKT